MWQNLIPIPAIIKNPKGVSKGVVAMTVDGREMEGNKAPIFTKGVHHVEVVMG